MRKEGNKDRINKNHLLANFINNGNVIPLLSETATTNMTAYTLIKRDILNMDLMKKSKIKDILMVAVSGNVGADGLDVQLFDTTNATEIALINFSGAEDFTLKTVSLNSYLQSITGRIVILLRIRKAGAVGPSSVIVADLEFYGKLSGTQGD